MTDSRVNFFTNSHIEHCDQYYSGCTGWSWTPETLQSIASAQYVNPFGNPFVTSQSFRWLSFSKITNATQCLVPSPLSCPAWVTDDDGVLLISDLDKDSSPEEFTFVEKAGPREKLFFNAGETTIGLVTCGGDLCASCSWCTVEKDACDIFQWLSTLLRWTVSWD